MASRVVEQIIANVERGELPTIEDLGGASAVQGAIEELARLPFLDAIAEIISRSTDDSGMVLDAVLLRGLEVGNDPVSFRTAVHTLCADARMSDRLGERAGGILVQRVKARRGQALLAAYALEGLLILALREVIPPFDLQSLLNSLTEDEEDLFAVHAAKLAGVTFQTWPHPTIERALQRLLLHPEAEAEAACELGYLNLGLAFAASQAKQCLEALEKARFFFQHAIKADEQRDDAIAYQAVIDLVLAFSRGATDEVIEPIVSTLEKSVWYRSASMEEAALPDWLRPRLNNEIEWAVLAHLARSVSRDLARPSWSKAYKVLDQVLALYDCERIVGHGPGLNNLVRPRIERAFVRERGLLAHLDELLMDSEWASEFKQSGHALRLAINEIVSNNKSGPTEAFELRFPHVPASLASDPAFRALPDDLAWKVACAMRDYASTLEGTPHPVHNEIVSQLIPGLDNNLVYAGEVRTEFNQILRQIILFCANRMNVTKGWDEQRLKYLFADKADEKDLQRDLNEYLIGNLGWTSNVRVEVTGIGSGRVDILVYFGFRHYVIELKCERSDGSKENLSKYIDQSIAYQATGIRLGFLGVLDLSPRSGPPPTLAENVWLQTHIPNGQSLPRSVVVFRVPGRLKSPSSFSK